MTIGLLVVGCGDPPPVVVPTRQPWQDAPSPTPEFEASTWGKFHSTRFRITLPLPDGRAWRIDDHKNAYLTAYHAGTNSHVTLYTSVERELVNHKACEDRARDSGLIPREELSTVESTITIGPEAYDSRIWVAAEPVKKRSMPLTGHVFLIGAYVRTCLFLHLQTTVDSAEEEAKLSARLASARVTMLNGLKIDPPRTTEESEVPRAKPATDLQETSK
jgi:hypothetical protein